MRTNIFFAICTISLVTLSAWVLAPTVEAPRAGEAKKTQPSAPAKKPAPVPLTKQDILADTRPRFGLSAPQVPFSSAEIGALADHAGRRPTLLQYFTKWSQNFRPDAVDASYKQGALPLISWEPWDGVKAGDNQPKYSLAGIASGLHDAYVRKFASDIAAHNKPVALRFAHEMNGHWYPWSESRSGNKRGDYVKAWRHIHDVFREAGATKVIWVWSPNIIRPVRGVDLKALYPGDQYVDWVGMVGYAVGESTAASVFEPTIDKMRAFTQLPIVVTETGAENGPKKAPWIKDFMRWVGSRNDIAGFIWFEFSKEQGGSADWRFTKEPEYIAAFKAGLATIDLADPPKPAAVPSATPSPSATPTPTAGG
jgi:beta-mannanase